MMPKVRGPSRVALSATVTGALVLVIVAAAAIFSIARGTSEVAAAGTNGILGEATLSAAAATRNAATQSHFLAEANELGVASSADLDDSVERTSEAILELDRRVDQLREEIDDAATDVAITAGAEDLATVATDAIDAIQAGDLGRSDYLVRGDLTTTYEVLVEHLVALRNQAFNDIAIARDESGRLADAARFLVVLLVPAAILLAYRSRIKRTQRQVELEAQLEKETVVSKTKSDFISHISHELRTPLTGIYGSALELNDPAIYGNAALSREFTALITEESAELARMVEDILAVAAEDKGQLAVDLRQIDPIDEIGNVVEPLEIVGHKTNRHLDPAMVLADPRLFRQVISNLLSNAHRYGLQPVTIRARVDGTHYVVDVVDNGPGIDPKVEDRLFDRYIHEGDSPLTTGSIGLGLFVAKILVTRMDGTIGYERRDNTTVFTVRMPLANR